MLGLLLAVAAVAVCPDLDLDARSRRLDPTADALDPVAVAHALAPVLYLPWSRRVERRHWDLPVAVDFDGDLVGWNNASAIRSGRYRDRLVPTLYWAVIETETHVFATYHLFHPIDWHPFPPTFDFRWHENDGENLQVVARKVRDGLAIELVLAQAHLGATLAVGPDAGLWLADGRPAILQERGGHGLYPAHRRRGRFAVGPPDPVLRRGLRLDPAAPGDPVPPPGALDTRGGYVLVPTEEVFWQGYLEGTLVELVARGFATCTEMTGPLVLPRHYASRMPSGPFKRDAGISPFAVAPRLVGPRARLGTLFFDPAARYPELVPVPEPWSRVYLHHPYAGLDRREGR